jgi:exodeoxyribonuclease X
MYAALARHVWEDAEAHNISALIYLISKGSEKARKCLKVHIELMRILLTANILMHIIHQLNIKNIEQLYIASEQARIPKSITFGKHKGLLFKIMLTIFNGYFAKMILIHI